MKYFYEKPKVWEKRGTCMDATCRTTGSLTEIMTKYISGVIYS